MNTLDGMNIRAEYARLCALECWHPRIRTRPPKLDIVYVRKGNVRTLGTARWQTHEIRLRIRAGRHTKYDVMETMVHELAHIDAERRAEDYANEHNKPKVKVGHSAAFWASMDRGFAAAYPDAVKHVGPQVNRYHGRYTKALRAAAGLPEHKVEPRPKTMGPWVEIPSDVPGAQVFVQRPAATVTAPAPDEPLIPSGGIQRLTTGVIDGKVLNVVKTHPGSTRDELDELFDKMYGTYPGKTVYNSLWRLRRDGEVRREGHRWYATKVGQ